MQIWYQCTGVYTYTVSLAVRIPASSRNSSERKTIITSVRFKFNGGKHDAHGTLKLAHTFTLHRYH